MTNLELIFIFVLLRFFQTGFPGQAVVILQSLTNEWKEFSN